MSKHVGELSVLIVDHLFGQLPSRVLQALFLTGRHTFPALLHHTSLSPRQLRHSLAVLIQEHLVLWYTSDENGVTSYEANQEVCCDLIRSGKYLTITEERLQEPATSVVSHLITHGHTSVGLLMQACKSPSDNFTQKKPLRNGFKCKEADKKFANSNYSIDLLHGTICDLLSSGLIQIVHESNFRPPADNRLEAEKFGPLQDGLNVKMKAAEALEFEIETLNRQYDWKHGTETQRVEISRLKGSKVRESGNLAQPAIGKSQLSADSKLTVGNNLRDDVILRINHDKFSVIERSNRLVDMAEDCIGTLTSQIYAAGLRILEKDQLQCKVKTIDSEDVKKLEGRPIPQNLPQFSTDDLRQEIMSHGNLELRQILAHDSTKLADNIGYVNETELNMGQYDHPKKRRRRFDSEDSDSVKVEGFASPDETDVSGDDGEENISGVDSDPDDHLASGEYKPINAESRKRRRAHSAAPLKPPPSPLTQHLLLLVTHKYKFLHHLPATLLADERWSVDMHDLSKKLLSYTIMQTITSRFTPLAARLIRILQQKGKVDEKTLTSLSLMGQKHMRALLTRMNREGFAEVQEIPKDNQRAPSKAIYLWFFDEERCRKRVLDDTYKAMCRVLQRISVERDKVKATVEKSERVDVEGKEDELLGESEKTTLAEWRAKQERLLGQLMRLDDLVSVLRDF